MSSLPPPRRRHWVKPRERLVTVRFPAELRQQVVGQYQDILDYHVARFSPYTSAQDQMAQLAFDAYLQGVLDGARVGMPKGDKT